MALELIAKIKCDMCGREDSLPYKEGWRWGRVETDVPSVVAMFPHWRFLSREGYDVKDYRMADGKVLCEECANRYKDAIEQKRKELDAMFEA